ncbi:hypothetical protein Droror1_Dr00019312 [Drosera rotundifolia]
MKRAEKLCSSGIPIILNTFDALDNDVLQAISAFSPPIYAIGPQQLYLNQLEDDISKGKSNSLTVHVAIAIFWQSQSVQTQVQKRKMRSLGMQLSELAVQRR